MAGSMGRGPRREVGGNGNGGSGPDSRRRGGPGTGGSSGGAGAVERHGSKCNGSSFGSTGASTTGRCSGSAAVLSHGTVRLWPQAQNTMAPAEFSGRPRTFLHFLHSNQIMAAFSFPRTEGCV